MSEWVDEREMPRTGRRVLLPILVLLGLTLIGVGAVALAATEDHVGLVLVGLVAVLAALGTLSLFGLAFGFISLGATSQSEPLAPALMDALDEGCALVDGAGRVIFANRAYLDLTGSRSRGSALSPEGLFGHAPEAAQAMFRLAEAARRGQDADEEIRLDRTLNGEAPAWFRIRTIAISSQDGDRRQIWRVSDVTRERERQETVFRELQHAIEFLDHAPAGFFSLNREGVIDYMNATLASWIGRDLAEIGSGGLALEAMMAPSDHARLLHESGPAHESRIDVIETELQSATGGLIPVRLLHQIQFDAAGRTLPSRTLVIDRRIGAITREESVSDDYRFSKLFNASPFGIAMINSEGKIIRTNSAFTRIMPAGLGKVGSVFSSIIAADDQDRFANLIDLTASNKSDDAPVDLKLASDGRSARLFVTRLHADAPGDDAAIIHLLDTTEQRALEAQFAQAQKMQAVGELAGGVAHDFNNVLQGILGYADLLLANHRPTDPAFQDIMEIKHNVNRAAGLVGHLLAFSRRQTLLPVVFHFTEILPDLSRLLKRLIGFRITLEVKHDRDLWLVKADRTQFEQVIINLAMNARDAMPQGGELLIRTANIAASATSELGDTTIPSADYVMIEITDTGTGIAPEVLDKIFQPFFTTKEVGKGTGLGLSMVYGFVKQSGGFILCDSKQGEGTRFRILLPRHIPEAGERVVKADAAAPAKPSADLSGQGTILLVEDEDAVRAFGARALTQRGYRVLEAATGVEALSLLETEAVDLIVSDVVMPEMDGPTLLGEARARGITSRFIFVSGYAEEAFRKNLPEGEEFGFLPKPFSLKQLTETVKDSLG
ncbi:MAG: response regulator [Hyphomicrobiales bacterium]|jgi:two-component system cell cycle sensor histidine kinase/response regulator CckA|nr:response regulator [Hyphomicrobiales bacterium]